MSVRNEWNTYTLGRYSEQPDETKLKATVTQAEKDRTISDDVSVVQSDYTKLKSSNKITDGTNIGKVTDEGYQEVQTHTPEHCFDNDYAGAQTDQEIHTPNSGKKLRIRQVYVSTKTTNVDVTLKFSTTGNIFFKLYTAQKAAQAGNVICATGDVNEGVELTCGAGTFVSMGYDEVD